MTSDDQKCSTPEDKAAEDRRGGSALMLKVNRHPGWLAVMNQARDRGMTVTEDDSLHLTVVFFGRDLSEERAVAARRAVVVAASRLTSLWDSKQLRDSLTPKDDHWTRPCVPLRFPGTIGEFRNKKSTHVHAVAEVSAVLVGFRAMVIEAYGRVSGKDYRPHVTLAEGPAGSTLGRPMRVPSGVTVARELVLKIGRTRTGYSL